MAKFCPLFSSSGGNSVYVGCGEDGVLIDVGMSAKQTDIALHNIGVDPDSIRAIFITHEHSDHVKGLRVFAAKHKIKIYATKGTAFYLDNYELSAAKDSLKCEIADENGTEAGEIFVKPFRTSHDARESCGYTLETPDGRKIAVATDMGYVSDAVHNAINGCDLVMLESNHDVKMLENGPYPYQLKERILSNKGHLSNDACAEEAVKLIQSGTTRLFLGHLSRENNFPELAYQTTHALLTQAGMREDSDYILKVAKPVWEDRAVAL